MKNMAQYRDAYCAMAAKQKAGSEFLLVVDAELVVYHHPVAHTTVQE